MPHRSIIAVALVCAALALSTVVPGASAAPVAVDMATRGDATWTLYSDGSVTASGGGGLVGDVAGLTLNGPPLAIEAAPSGGGYWIIGADGGVFAFGTAKFLGSTGAMRLNKPIVGMAATPTGNGYWLVASDGGIFAYGDAPFRGSTGAIRLNKPIVGMAATPTGNGYWLLASDGGIFSYGDAAFHGSAVGHGTAVSIEAAGEGYRILLADGQTLSFAPSTPPPDPDPEPAVGEVVRVSVASGGTETTGSSYSSWYDASSDGHYVAFDSDAPDLVPGDTNGVTDVFLHDLHTGETTRISVASDGSQGDDHSGSVSMSADGRYVAFDSSATNLVAGDTNGETDVFLHDRDTGTTTRISVTSAGEQGDGQSFGTSMSADGTRIAFMSSATNLSDRDAATNAIYVHDTTTGETVLASVGDDPDTLSHSVLPSISADGRYVVWLEESDSELIPGTHEIATEVAIKDLQTNELSVVRQDVFGESHTFGFPFVSADGHYVAFGFSEHPSAQSVRYDRTTDTATTLSATPTGDPGNALSDGGPMSDDGRFVVFWSEATDLVPDDTNGMTDVFVRDVDSATTRRLSQASDGTQANGRSDFPQISGDGRYAIFSSQASNLVPGDTNGGWDVFVVRLR